MIIDSWISYYLTAQLQGLDVVLLPTPDGVEPSQVVGVPLIACINVYRGLLSPIPHNLQKMDKTKI